jgi:hypothetical protein
MTPVTFLLEADCVVEVVCVVEVEGASGIQRISTGQTNLSDMYQRIFYTPLGTLQ